MLSIKRRNCEMLLWDGTFFVLLNIVILITFWGTTKHHGTSMQNNEVQKTLNMCFQLVYYSKRSEACAGKGVKQGKRKWRRWVYFMPLVCLPGCGMWPDCFYLCGDPGIWSHSGLSARFSCLLAPWENIDQASSPPFCSLCNSMDKRQDWIQGGRQYMAVLTPWEKIWVGFIESQ